MVRKIISQAIRQYKAAKLLLFYPDKQNNKKEPHAKMCSQKIIIISL